MRKPPILLTDDIVSARASAPAWNRRWSPIRAPARSASNAGACKEIKHQPPCLVSSFCKTYGTNYLDNGDIINNEGQRDF
jgi:hypothetical protein